jgi:Zn-dependent protease
VSDVPGSEVPRGPIEYRKTWRQKLSKAGAGAAVAGGAALKFGGKLALLGKSLLVLAKFKTALSMLISVALYSVFWGWKFAVGFVLLILVHEFGHVVVLRAQGVKASAPMFIPFLGAFVKVEGPQRSVVQEAVSSLAGPAFGLLGAAGVFVAAQQADSPFLYALAYTGFLLNLFNLAPVLPLDGGRVAGALHPAIWIAGMLGALALLIFFPSPVAIFILIMGGMETWRRWRDRKAGRTGSYFDVPAVTRWRIGAAYAVVVLACVYGMHAAYLPPPS